MACPRILRSALGSALRAARTQAPRCAADPGCINILGWVPALRSSVPDDASHRRENAAPRPGRKTSRRRSLQQPFRCRPRLGGDLGAGQHAGDFLAAMIGGERVDAGGDALALVEGVL